MITMSATASIRSPDITKHEAFGLFV